MVVFAFSCFAILLFLWLQFGGADAAQAGGVPVKVGFPEAVGLLQDMDVRTAGITIGTVRDVEVEAHRQPRAWPRSRSTPEYAPLSSDARAILRRKTLLGETFVEITTGSADARRSSPTAGGWPTRGGGDRRARRDPPDLRPADPARVPDLAAAARRGGRATAART